MIRFIKGNLLESTAQALVNTVNTVGVMGKGIALQFKEAYPNNYILYRKACKDKLVRVGSMFITQEQNVYGINKIIVNFPTKTTWRKPSEYSYIEMGLKDLKDKILEYHIESIAIPPLGSHNGGLDWNIVKQMIISQLSDLNCEIILYEPNEAIIELMKSERVKLTRQEPCCYICSVLWFQKVSSHLNLLQKSWHISCKNLELRIALSYNLDNIIMVLILAR